MVWRNRLHPPTLQRVPKLSMLARGRAPLPACVLAVLCSHRPVFVLQARARALAIVRV